MFDITQNQDGGISVVAKKTSRNRNVFLTTTIKLMNGQSIRAVMNSFVGKLSKAFTQKNRENSPAFTLLELIILIAIIGILMGIALPNYINYRNKGKIANAISEIKSIDRAISDYHIQNNKLPNSLADTGIGLLTDPWGRSYQYLRIDGSTTPGINGKRRRDKNANPVNSDYDLYSMGRDGKTTPQFTAKNARDDIVRASDGKYFGLADNH
jgi:general secretion pathway protein G